MLEKVKKEENTKVESKFFCFVFLTKIIEDNAFSEADQQNLGSTLLGKVEIFVIHSGISYE